MWCPETIPAFTQKTRDQSQKVTDHSLLGQVVDRVLKHPVLSTAADEPEVFVTFTGPAVWHAEAGHSWESKADRKPRGLGTTSSEALTPSRVAILIRDLASAQPDLSLAFERTRRSSTLESPRVGSAVPHLLC